MYNGGCLERQVWYGGGWNWGSTWFVTDSLGNRLQNGECARLGPRSCCACPLAVGVQFVALVTMPSMSGLPDLVICTVWPRVRRCRLLHKPEYRRLRRHRSVCGCGLGDSGTAPGGLLPRRQAVRCCWPCWMELEACRWAFPCQCRRSPVVPTRLQH